MKERVRKIIMTTAEKVIRILYATVAFGCALAMHMCASQAAYAQVDVTHPYTEETRLYDRLDKIDARLDSEDTREARLQDDLSHIEGIGEGGMAALGILQLIGLLKKFRDKEE